jgi:hypothetical protein
MEHQDKTFMGGDYHIDAVLLPITGARPYLWRAVDQDDNIGVCYGSPGVGKTLSARHDANWPQIEACSPYSFASDTDLAALVGSQTVFYWRMSPDSPNSMLGQERQERLVEGCWILARHGATAC